MAIVAGVPIEPRLTPNSGYVESTPRLSPSRAIASVREGPHQVRAKNLGKDLLRVDGKTSSPWCISRQLWWGHQIRGLVWSGRSGLRREDERRGAAAATSSTTSRMKGPWKAWVEEKLENFQPGEILTRDEDVLDIRGSLSALSALLDARLARTDAGTRQVLPGRMFSSPASTSSSSSGSPA